MKIREHVRPAFWVGVLILISVLVIWILIPSVSKAQGGAWTYYAYEIDRSAVPPVSFDALTVNLQVGVLDSAAVYIDGEHVEHNYDFSTGQISVTTSGERIELWVKQSSNGPELGQATFADLIDNKPWAWSHGMDDNVDLHAQMDVFDAYNVKGTMFLIGEILDDLRDEDWIVDVPEVHRRMANGWSIGSHSWESHCEDTNLESVKRSFDRLQAIAEASAVPDYKVIAFAAPCFVSEYHPILLELRNSDESYAQFNLSGNDNILNVAQEVDPAFDPEDLYVVPFDYSIPFGRDTAIEYDVESVLKNFDQMSDYAAEGRAFWYNTLTHGENEENIERVLNYVVNRYGENGSDEAWLAPADEVFSYILMRDNAVIRTVQSDALIQPPADTPIREHRCNSYRCLFIPMIISIMLF